MAPLPIRKFLFLSTTVRAAQSVSAMTIRSRVIGMVKATHFGLTVLVVSISFTLATTQLSFSKSFEIALGILAGQFVVGWTNELVDQERDTEARRTKKPLVGGSFNRR